MIEYIKMDESKLERIWEAINDIKISMARISGEFSGFSPSDINTRLTALESLCAQQAGQITAMMKEGKDTKMELFKGAIQIAVGALMMFLGIHFK